MCTAQEVPWDQADKSEKGLTERMVEVGFVQCSTALSDVREIGPADSIISTGKRTILHSDVNCDNMLYMLSLKFMAN